MAISSTQGSKLYIGGIRQGSTEDIEDFEALTWVEIKKVTNLGEFGEAAGQRIEDVAWMPEVAAAGEAVLMSDSIHKKKAEEARVLRDCGLRAFIVNAQLPAAETVRRFTVSLQAIERACRRPGPFVYRLHPERIERLRIRDV